MKYDIENLEKELRSALRRKEPPHDLAQWWRSRTRGAPWNRSRGILALAAAIIAVLLIPAAAVEYRVYQRHQEEGRVAKDKLVQAFHLAGAKVRMTKKMLRERSL